MKTISYFFALLIIMIGCIQKDSKIKFKDINKTVFFNIDNHTEIKNYSNQIEKDLNLSFKLSPIDSSNYESEIRIYFVNAFSERFFRQCVRKLKVESSLYYCKTEKSNDSLFMNIISLIGKEGEYDAIKSYINESKIISETLTDTISLTSADSGLFYFVQFRNGSKIVKIAISDPFEKEEFNPNAKFVCDLIREIKNKYSFNFYDPWLQIKDSAFRKN